jgi:hypothetical protein
MWVIRSFSLYTDWSQQISLGQRLAADWFMCSLHAGWSSNKVVVILLDRAERGKL